MNLRTLIFVGYIVVAFSVALILWSAVSLVLIDEYSSFEEKEAFRQTERIAETIENDIESLTATSRDWAWWDETYEFMDTNKAQYHDRYIAQNLQNYSLENIRTDILYYIDNNGAIIHETHSDSMDEIQELFLRNSFEEIISDFLEVNDTESISGLMNAGGSTVMVAGSHILPSDLNGTSRGVLILGKMMDTSYEDMLSKVTSGQVIIRECKESDIADTCIQKSRFTHCIRKENAQLIIGSVREPFLTENGEMCIITRMNRGIMQHGVNTILLLLVVTLLSTALSGFAVLFIIDRIAMKRLKRLMEGIRSQQKDIHRDSRDIIIKGKDEISELSEAFYHLVNEYIRASGESTRNELRFRNLSELLPVPVFECDLEGFIIFMNTEMADRFYLNPEEKNYKFQDFIEGTTGIEEHLQNGIFSSLQGTEILMKDSPRTHFPALLYLSPILLENIHSGWRGAVIDISTLKETEQDLITSRERLSLSLEGGKIAMWDYDLISGVTWVNDQFIRMLGEEKGDQSYSFESGVHPEELAHAEEVIWRCKTGEKEHFAEEIRRINSEGKVLWTLNVGKITQFDVYHRPSRITGIVMDLSDNHQLREALILTNRKLALLSTVTRHDIKNSIAGIFLILEVFEGRITGNEPAERCMALLKEGVEKILSQINFTSDYEELGLSPPYWQNVVEILQAAIADLPSTSIRIRCNLEDLKVFADPMLQKVFYNLIENAVRHGGPNLTQISIYSKIQSEGLDLIIENDGTGIPFSRKEEIFKRGIGENTGLGLFLVREILAVTMITISERGEEKKGVKFVIHIPHNCVRWEKPSEREFPGGISK